MNEVLSSLRGGGIHFEHRRENLEMYKEQRVEAGQRRRREAVGWGR